MNAYKLAYKHALATLEPVHPTRLGLALNFSVFYHGEYRSLRTIVPLAELSQPDVRKSPERACHLAKSAFDDAVMSLDTSDPDVGQNLRDSLMILQLLKDDLVLWATEMQDGA